MVQQATTTVKIDPYYGVSIEQAPGHAVGLELAEAIIVAKQVLAFAEDRMAEIADDSQSADEYEALSEALGDGATLAVLEQEALKREARWDAQSAHWGHD